MGDLNEKLTVLRETYEREWKANASGCGPNCSRCGTRQGVDGSRQLRGENADLARQLRDEQRRADKAEYSLIVQENEIMEWEEENQRKAEPLGSRSRRSGTHLPPRWHASSGMRRSPLRSAWPRSGCRKRRDGRKMDELKRGIRQDAAALNQMVLRPEQGQVCAASGLIVQAAEVAKIADMTVLNDRAVNQLTRLQNSIQASSAGSEGSPTAMTDRVGADRGAER